MNTKKELFKLMVLALSVSPLFSCGNDVNSIVPSNPSEPSEIDDSTNSRSISIVSPSDGSSLSLADSATMALLAASNSKDELKVLKEYQLTDCGSSPISLSWEANGSSSYQIQVSTDSEFATYQSFMISGIMNSYDLYNLIPNKTYYWRVKGTLEDDMSKTYTFSLTDSVVRPINASGAFNSRDIGGWTTIDGYKVNYGLLYRGGMLNGFNGVSTLDEDGIDIFKNQLGIKTEIDLRTTGQDDGNQKANHFNPEGLYIQAPVSQYTGVLERSIWDELPSNEKSGYLGSTKNSIKTIFEALANENNYPAYFHCNYGADRTGTLAFLINGLLGVDYKDLVKDFELTCFSSKAGIRYRSALNESGDDFDDSGVYQNNSNNFVAFGALYNNIMKYYKTSDNTLKSAIENYLTSYIGIAPTTIINFRKIMLNGYKSDDIIQDSNQEINLSDSSTLHIDLSGVDYDSVTDITVDGISLGNNPNQLTIPEDFKLFGEKEFSIKCTKGDKNFVVYTRITIVTKLLYNWEELIEAVQFGELLPEGETTKTYTRSNRIGYFRLANDITSPASATFGTHWDKISTDCQKTDGEMGFVGILDGNGHTITSKSGYGGLFALTGLGSEIKNVTFVDTNYDSKAVTSVIAVSAVGTKFNNVHFVCRNAATGTFENSIGWIASTAAVDCSFVNCSFEGNKISICSFFGGYKNWIGFKNTTFVNCTSSFKSISTFGYLYGTSTLISPETITGITGTLDFACEETNTIKIAEGEANLSIGKKYNDCEVVSVNLKGSIIDGADTDFYNGILNFSTKDILTDYDEGSSTVYVVLAIPNGFTINLKVPVYIEAPLEKINVSSSLIINLSDKSTYKFDIGQYNSMEVISISLGDLSFGDDINNLDIKSDTLSNPEIWGIKTFVVCGVYSGKKVIVNVKATVANMIINTLSDFNSAVGKGSAASASTGKAFDGYYVLGNDLSDVSFSDYVNGKAVYSYQGLDYGFQGTLDGANYTLSGQSNGSCYGIFCLLGNGAVIKNLNIVNHNFTYTAGGTSFAYSMYNVTLENVSFTFEAQGTDTDTIKNNFGWINAAGCQKSTFKNVTINADGLNIGSLFGGFNEFEPFYENNTFENFVINANSIAELGHYGEVGSAKFVSYNVDDFDGIQFNKK